MQTSIEHQLTTSINFYYRHVGIVVDEVSMKILVKLPLRTVVLAGANQGRLTTRVKMFGLPIMYVLAAGTIVGVLLIFVSARFVSWQPLSFAGSFLGAAVIVFSARHGRSTLLVREAVKKIMRQCWSV